MNRDLGTVYVAELMRRLKSRPFLIGIMIGVLAIWAFVKMPTFMNSAFGGSDAIVITGDARLVARAKPLLANDYIIKSSTANERVTPGLLKRNAAAAAVVLARHADTLDVTVYAKDPGSIEASHIRRDLLPLQVELATHDTSAQAKRLTDMPVQVKPIASKFANSSDALMAHAIAYTLIFFLYILILLNSQLVMSSVAEEKTSRIAELLIASVDPAALLAGKVLAAVTLALAQMVIWIGAVALIGSAALAPTGSASATASTLTLSGALAVVTPFVLLAFLVFFIIGLLQLSTMFAAVASLINRTEDLGSVAMPLILPVVLALFIAMATLGAPDSPWAVTLSFVPLFAPFVMFARIAVSNVPLWQIVLSLTINGLALWGIALLAGKIYRVGMLLYGRAPKFAQIWSVIRS